LGFSQAEYDLEDPTLLCFARSSAI